MQQSGTKEIEEVAWLGGKVIHLELLKRLKLLYYSTSYPFEFFFSFFSFFFFYAILTNLSL